MNCASSHKLTFIASLVCLSFALSGCGSGMQGTYSDASGAFTLDLKSGGKANFTFMGEVAQCAYTANGDKLALDCKGDVGKVVFTIHDDGSLTGPPGGFMPALRKTKS